MARPEENVAAYAALMSQLQAQVLSTRENAHAMVRNAGQAREYRLSTPQWEATEWAARRLLDDLRAITPPTVPEDPERGQATLEEVMEPEHHPDRLMCQAETRQDCNVDDHWEGRPQPGDKPVDEVSPTAVGPRYPHTQGPGCWCRPDVSQRDGQTFVRHSAWRVGP
jgi:hypothetical protein